MAGAIGQHGSAIQQEHRVLGERGEGGDMKYSVCERGRNKAKQVYSRTVNELGFKPM